MGAGGCSDGFSLETYLERRGESVNHAEAEILYAVLLNTCLFMGPRAIWICDSGTLRDLNLWFKKLQTNSFFTVHCA